MNEKTEAETRWRGNPANPIPVWLCCDTGHDDAFAILLAAQSPALKLLGVSTVYGNAPLSKTTYNTRAILKAIDREDVPVYPGASKPFCREAAAAPDIHGESGLDGTTHLPEPTVPAKTEPAVLAMYKALISQPPKTAWLVAVGAMTNVALLFAVYPDLADHIAGLSIMGGAVGGGFTDAPMGKIEGEGERVGNWSRWAEFNIYIDPESAHAIFSNPILAEKTTIAPIDLTHQMIATPEVIDNLLHGYGSQRENSVLRVLFKQILTFFAKTYADVFALVEGPPLHDPLAVAACFVPDLFNDEGGERFSVNVITAGEHGVDEITRDNSQCGRTVVSKLPEGEAGVRIPRGLRASVIWRILDLCMKQAEGENPKQVEAA
ncbi:hypothetical protein AAFC00_004678 [Neodothiora populina]|uniref:Inosine/uridine-preferring nucleoside hydrolase domain-containing protein n=1 Tax=Neodothiora populina TaxID=2781224 RepID=A0ABR3P470_9PEZI